MGEVYRAVDRSLDRQVAIKILPAAFSEDVERLARFEREAKLLAALNHPHIAAIHGLEEADGRRFLVLELVEGLSLRARLMKGPLSIEEALETCRQIAEGLEAAHEKGIVHRDLKPGNIMLSSDGNAKILDFGLAKASGPEPLGPEADKSPTITGRMTAPGVVLGTAAYMSPEQARGRAIDKRTDIWAFGCVLYECLTGKRAFQGETVSDTMAQILKGEPDWQALPAGTPASIRSLLERCLEKDPKERLHDIADARIELSLALRSPEDVIASPAISRRRPMTLLAVGAAAVIIGILIGPAIRNVVRPKAILSVGPVVRSSIRLQPNYRLGGEDLDASISRRLTRTEMALSADGQILVYSASKMDAGPEGKAGLFVRKLEELEPVPVKGTEGGHCPFLSPKGDWIGFWSAGRLKKIPIEGGIATDLCAVQRPFGFSWGDDDRIVFVPDRGSGLMRIPASGGSVETLTVPDRSRGEYAHCLPHVLPGARGILFTIKRHPWDVEPRLAILDLRSGQWRVLLENAADGRYAATGHVVFLRQGTLMAVPFDLRRLELTGQAVPVVAGVEQTLNTTESYNDTGAGQFSLSASGCLVYAPGSIDADQENSLVWVDAEGRDEKIVSFKAPFFSTQLSPDGKRIAYTLLGMEGHVWVLVIARGTATMLTTEGMAEWALWTPDGERLIFDWLESGVPNLYCQAADGGSPMERLTESQNFQFAGSISPDGGTLAFVELSRETDYDIHFLDLRQRRVTPFLNSRFFEGYPKFSPDGRLIAYVTDESGRMEVYVQALSGRKGKWRISQEGGASPLWAPDGRRLYYRSGRFGEKVWAVDVDSGPNFSAARPLLLFDQKRYQRGSPVGTWDISRDGRKFLMVRFENMTVRYATELVLVENWFGELERLVQAGKKKRTAP
jgi:serine/threonine-protein kinase